MGWNTAGKIQQQKQRDKTARVLEAVAALWSTAGNRKGQHPVAQVSIEARKGQAIKNHTRSRFVTTASVTFQWRVADIGEETTAAN